MSDIVSRFDSTTLMGALGRDAVALNNVAKATNDVAHNLAAEQTIAGRPRNTFQDVYYSHSGGEAAGYVENDVRYYIRGAGAPVDSQVKTHLSLLGDASFFAVQGPPPGGTDDTTPPTSSSTQYFTRVGTFNFNASNQLQNHFGMKLMYVPAVNGVLPATPSGMEALDCSSLSSTSTKTSEITFKCGLIGNVGDSLTRAITVYDSSGTPRTLNYVFKRLADVNNCQAWSLEIQAPSGSTVSGAYSAGSPSNTNAAGPVTIQFDSNGCPASYTYNLVSSSTPPNLSITCPGNAIISTAMNLGTVGKADGVVRITGGQSRLQVIVDGNPSGQFSGVNFDENGRIYASFDNGQNSLIGALAVGTFNNPDGLMMLDSGVYAPNPSISGSPTFSYLGTPQAGNVAVGALESSTIETIPNMAKMIERQQQFNNMVTVFSTINDLMEQLNNLDT